MYCHNTHKSALILPAGKKRRNIFHSTAFQVRIFEKTTNKSIFGQFPTCSSLELKMNLLRVTCTTACVFIQNLQIFKIPLTCLWNSFVNYLWLGCKSSLICKKMLKLQIKRVLQSNQSWFAKLLHRGEEGCFSVIYYASTMRQNYRQNNFCVFQL